MIRGDSPWLLPLFADSLAPRTELMEWLRGFDLILGWRQGKGKVSLEKSHFFYYQAEMPESISRFFFRRTVEVLGEDQFAKFSFEECARLPSSRAQKKGHELINKAGPKVRFVVVHPGSGGEKKCWAAQNFLEMIERLGQNKVAGALVTGEAEKRMEALIEKTALPPGWSWLRCPSLVLLSSLLQEADLYLGNDSGITHLAGACGTEAVALFRKELVRAWQPYGLVRLISAPSLEEISIDCVWKTVSRRLHLS